MKRCFLFDVDGTLTEPRKRIDPIFSHFFEGWASQNVAYLVSGSDLPKIKEQLGQDIIDSCNGIFACMGNEYWKGEQLIYANKFKPNNEVYDYLLKQLSRSDWKIAMPPHIEERTGMMNFSILGRGAEHDLRKQYNEWDAEHKQRETIAQKFNEKFSNKYNLQAVVGGAISIDIQEIGKDKGQIMEHIDYDETIFFGDMCQKGGNDYSLAQKVSTAWNVESPKDTYNILNLKYE